MNKKIVIAIDAMGGEQAPKKNIEGINIFYNNNKNISDYFFNIYGNEELINVEIKKYKIPSEIYKIHHSNSVVSDDETPLTAIKNSKESSMWNSINSQITSNSDISLSAGNTGVLFVISRMILKTMEQVSKPALAGLWPNKKNMNVVLDLGANIDCDENNLVDFAEMGSALFKSLFPSENPKVGLLNIGSEEIKGTEVLKKAYTILQKMKPNDFEFNGFLEANKIMDGETNVIVTDGFTGNIALKTAEGTAKFITDTLKKNFN
jgi:glycerol-3-phosphate acyltransferase PlsX